MKASKARTAAVVVLALLLLLVARVATSRDATPEPDVRDGKLSPELSALVQEMLREPEPRSGQGGARAGMMLYSRAFAAYALVNEALADPGVNVGAQVDALIAQVLRPVIRDAFGKSPSVAYRGHLALMLVARERLGPLREEHAAVKKTLLHGLAAEILADPNHLIPSYGQRTWPADNEVLAAAFELETSPDPAVRDALAALQGSLAKLEERGLPASEVEPDSLKGKDVPRGCALSWTVAMRGLYSPERARSLYEPYRKAFFTRVGPVVGFREWPRGVDRPADADSGPIVLGFGTAASGLALGASRLAGHWSDHRELRFSSGLAGAGWLENARGKQWLERAMLAWAKTARTWCPAGQTRPSDPP